LTVTLAFWLAVSIFTSANLLTKIVDNIILAIYEQQHAFGCTVCVGCGSVHCGNLKTDNTAHIYNINNILTTATATQNNSNNNNSILLVSLSFPLVADLLARVVMSVLVPLWLV
jgi:hypothetical protein